MSVKNLSLILIRRQHKTNRYRERSKLEMQLVCIVGDSKGIERLIVPCVANKIHTGLRQVQSQFVGLTLQKSNEFICCQGHNEFHVRASGYHDESVIMQAAVAI